MKFGIAILCVMAAVWAGWSLYAAHLAPWTYVAAAAVALAPLVLMSGRQILPRSAEDARRIGRLVGWASFAEGVAIFGGVQVVVRMGRPDLIVCLVAAVAGLHFLPLARWMPMPRYYLTGLALVAAAGLGLVAPVAYRTSLVAGASAAIGWLTALSAVLALPKRRAQPAQASRPG